MYQQHMLLKLNIKETYFEIYTKQVSCPLALSLLNISNCQSVLKYLSIVYMTAVSPNLIL